MKTTAAHLRLDEAVEDEAAPVPLRFLLPLVLELLGGAGMREKRLSGFSGELRHASAALANTARCGRSGCFSRNLYMC